MSIAIFLAILVVSFLDLLNIIDTPEMLDWAIFGVAISLIITITVDNRVKRLKDQG